MSTITTVLEAVADGVVHLAVPMEWRGGKVRIAATVEAVAETPSHAPENGSPLDALLELRKLGGLHSIIPDPVEWQRARSGKTERCPIATESYVSR